MKGKILSSSVLVILLVLIIPRCSFATYYLFDNRLRVQGNIYNFSIYATNLHQTTDTGSPYGPSHYRNTHWGLFRTKGTINFLFKAVDCPDNILNFYGMFKWFYEATPDIDERYREAITPKLRRDWYNGPWNIRAGKQVVFWSEVELVRTVDQINQLDLRYSTPGSDPWSEIKLGLWMIRGFYNSQLPGQLTFELIWIPGDFQPIRTPTEGTFWGAPPNDPPTPKSPPYYGELAALETQWRKSKPQTNLKHSSIAARIRGNSEITLFKTPYTLDWSLSWFHGMNNTPVVRKKYLGVPNPKNLDPNTLNGYDNLLAQARLNGDPYPDLPNHRFWNYKFYDIIGGTLQTYVPKLHGVVRTEIAYELNHPENTAFPDYIDSAPSYSKLITGTATRNIVNFGLTYDVPIRLKFLQHQNMQWLGANGILQTIIGNFEQWRLGSIDDIRRTFAYKDKVQTGFTLTCMTNFKNNAIMTILRAQYNTRKWGYVAPAIAYTPGIHMRYTFGYMAFFAHNVWDFDVANAKGKDCLYLNFGYEF
jgi:hypothetical protein